MIRIEAIVNTGLARTAGEILVLHNWWPFGRLNVWSLSITASLVASTKQQGSSSDNHLLLGPTTFLFRHSNLISA
jgi:hypothetical protein